MKVGKECTMGLVNAIEGYLDGGKRGPVTRTVCGPCRGDTGL